MVDFVICAGMVMPLFEVEGEDGEVGAGEMEEEGLDGGPFEGWKVVEDFMAAVSCFCCPTK